MLVSLLSLGLAVLLFGVRTLANVVIATRVQEGILVSSDGMGKDEQYEQFVQQRDVMKLHRISQSAYIACADDDMAIFLLCRHLRILTKEREMNKRMMTISEIAHYTSALISQEYTDLHVLLVGKDDLNIDGDGETHIYEVLPGGMIVEQPLTCAIGSGANAALFVLNRRGEDKEMREEKTKKSPAFPSIPFGRSIRRLQNIMKALKDMDMHIGGSMKMFLLPYVEEEALASDIQADAKKYGVEILPISFDR
jgi:20S proteasome alpha/beta subunit